VSGAIDAPRGARFSVPLSASADRSLHYTVITLNAMPLDPDPTILRAIVSTIVPEAAALDDRGWLELNQVVEALLRDRPESLKRQVRMFLTAIQWLPVLRYGRAFTRLHPAARARFLAHLQNDPIQKVRVGFWGLRTIVLAGYYGRPQAAQAIGYNASPGGWEASR
jgi:hypothetical protein